MSSLLKLFEYETHNRWQPTTVEAQQAKKRNPSKAYASKKSPLMVTRRFKEYMHLLRTTITNADTSRLCKRSARGFNAFRAISPKWDIPWNQLKVLRLTYEPPGSWLSFSGARGVSYPTSLVCSQLCYFLENAPTPLSDRYPSASER